MAMTSPQDEKESAKSILKELIFNQYQAIVLGGVAAASLIIANPLPFLVWLGGELVLLPFLDSGPLRRLAQRRRMAAAREQDRARRAHLLASFDAAHARRYAAMEQTCRHIEANYQGLHGISQAYLSEQRAKLDMILQGCLHRMMALQRYDRLLAARDPADIEKEIAGLERELQQPELLPRARAALEKNLELKRRLLASLADARGTMKALATELDSMASLLEVLHQNSVSMRDPQAISQELDSIVSQSEDSQRVVQEMEALLRAGTLDWSDGGAAQSSPATMSAAPPSGPAARQRVRRR
jgi:hypothetical protein